MFILYHEACVGSNPLVRVEHIEVQRTSSLVESLHASWVCSNAQDTFDKLACPLDIGNGPIFVENILADVDSLSKEIYLQNCVSSRNIDE